MPTAPYVEYIDELKVFGRLLRDPTYNHHLNEIVQEIDGIVPGGDDSDRDQTIIRRPADHWGQLPSVELYDNGSSPFQAQADQIEEGFSEDRYTQRLRVLVRVGRDQEIVYNGIRFVGGETTGKLIDHVIKATFYTANTYTDPRTSNLWWVDVARVGHQFRPPEDGGAVDVREIFYTFTMVERRELYYIRPV